MTYCEEKWIKKFESNNPNFGYNLRLAHNTNAGKLKKKSLTEHLILQWINAYQNEHNCFPTRKSGIIHYAAKEYLNITWIYYQNHALIDGIRGLLGGMSLEKFIRKHFKIKYKLKIEEIKQWISLWRQDKGYDPIANQELIPYDKGFKGLTWGTVDVSLAAGRRGLPGGLSLLKLKQSLGSFKTKKQLGIKRGCYKPLSIKLILEFLLSYKQKYYKFPSLRKNKKDIIEHPLANNTTWGSIDTALRKGQRGIGHRLILK